MEQNNLAGTHRAVWRWHFYAGLFVTPVLLLLAITGASYLFEREFDSWWNRELLTVVAAPASLPLATQEAAVTRAYPTAKISRVRLPRTDDEASAWLIGLQDGEQRDIYVNPYSASVIGESDPARQPMNIARKLHGELLSGTVGSYLVELTACWTLVMLITGIYLWWPRSWHWRVFIPRSGAGGRAFWRDWHAIPTLFNAALLMFLVLTGLPWSVFWGARFAQLGEVLPFVQPSPNFTSHAPKSRIATEPPTAAAAHATHNRAASELPWTIQHLHAPASAGQQAIGIGDVEPHLSALEQQRYGAGVRIFYPSSDTGSYMINYVPDKAQGQRTLYIDAADGTILGNIGWSDYSPVAKLVEWGVMTHMGRQFGLMNQLMGALVCALIVATVVTGIVMWWRRRPVGTLAAPRTLHGDQLPGALKVTLATMAVVFPLLGASLLLVWALDRLLR